MVAFGNIPTRRWRYPYTRGSYFFCELTFPSSVLTPFGCQNSAPRIARRRLILLLCLFKLFGTLAVTVFLLYASAGALKCISFTGIRFPRMYRGILPRYNAPRIGRRRLILLLCLFKLFGTLVVTVFLIYASAGALRYISFMSVRFPRMYRGILPRYNAPRIVRSKAYDTGRLFLIAHQGQKETSLSACPLPLVVIMRFGTTRSYRISSIYFTRRLTAYFF